MRGALALVSVLVAALALSGCMGRTAPVAMASQNSLDTIAYGQSYAGPAPTAIAYAEPAPLRYDASYHLDAGDKLRVVIYGQEGLTNIYAELGATFGQMVITSPLVCGHVLGMLVQAFGADHVLWGTDSIWYGSPQPLIDAFRAFRIPEELRERHGYPELTPAIRRKILGGNAARVYGIDLASLRERARNDELAWVREALAAQRLRGTPRA